ncbi:MAG: DsbA family protein [Pseudomonadota bacterium]
MKTIGRRGLILGGGAIVAGAGAFALLKSGGGHVATARAFSGSSNLAWEPPHGDRWLGAEDAPVTVIEFASATCPHCANFHKGTWPKLKEEYIDTGKIKFIMREFPLDHLSLAGFMVARCAPDGRYFDMLDVLFKKQRTWTGHDPRGELFKIARQAGATQKSFDACLVNEDLAKGIAEARDHASSKLGVASTPTFYINETKLTGNQPISAFRKHIDGYLDQTG